MSRPAKERDEQKTLKVDDFFKDTLARLKPYVLSLNSPEKTKLCRLWVDKLSHTSGQRNLRNAYLVELYRQLKTGRLNEGGVFSKPPPPGHLLPLSNFRTVNCSSSLSDLSDTSTSSPDRQNCRYKQNAKRLSQRGIPRSTTPFHGNRRKESDSSSTTQCHVHHLPSKNSKLTNSAVRFYEETSDTVEKSDEIQIYRKQIETLTAMVRKLQTDNERLGQEVVELRDSYGVNETSHLQAHVKQLSTEVSSLKAKLMDMHKTKEILEANHREIINQYKNAMNEQFHTLKDRLQEAQNKNVELDNNLLLISQKLEDITRGKEEETIALEKKWGDKIETTRQDYEKLIKQKDEELLLKICEHTKQDEDHQKTIETMHSKISELEAKLENKTEDESKLRLMLTEQYSNMKDEFMRMRAQTEMSNQKQNEALLNENAYLKKTISKLEKSKKQLSYDYEKMYRMLKNQELEMRALRLKLEGQRSELSTSLSSEKQCELDNLVTMLEERYKTLLAATDATVDGQRQHYLKKISILEDQLIVLKKSVAERRGSTNN